MRMGYVLAVAAFLAGTPALAEGVYNGDADSMHHGYTYQPGQERGAQWQGQHVDRDRADNGRYDNDRSDNGDWQKHAYAPGEQDRANRWRGDDGREHAYNRNGRDYDRNQAEADRDWQAQHSQDRDADHNDHDHGLTLRLGH